MGLLESFAREGTFALPVFLSAQKRHHGVLSMCADRPQAVSPIALTQRVNPLAADSACIFRS
jgi:hypothetical protein